MTKRQALENAYFDRLEDNLEDFIEVDEAFTNSVKPEYLVSVEDMCDYLGMPQWVKEWTVALIEEEENGVVVKPLTLSGSTYEDFRPYMNNKQGEIVL